MVTAKPRLSSGSSGIAIAAVAVAPTGSLEEKIPRYAPQQRIHHWLLAVAFVGLLATGLAILLGAPADVLRATGLVHRAAAILLTVAPLYYAVTYPKGLLTLLRDSFTYDKDDVQWLIHAPAYFIGHAEQMPPQGRINAGEKVHHALVTVSLVAIAVSGYVLWLGKGGNPTAFLAAGLIHDLSMAILTVLFVGHLYFTFVYQALGAMIDGTVTRRYAQLEHRKWLDALDGRQAARLVRSVGPGRGHKGRRRA
jgi:formate dehydrogenase subunit gamma